MKQEKLKVVTVISDVDYALAYEWLSKHFDKTRFEPVFILISPAEPKLLSIIRNQNCEAYYLKSGGKFSMPFLFLKVLRLFIKLKPQIIHGHLFLATLLSLIAAKLLRIENRIFTRHHSTNNLYYYPGMVKYDKLMSSAATRIVAVSNLVKSTMVQYEGANPNKITVINHGLDFNSLEQVSSESINKLRIKYNLNKPGPVIGAISRFIHLKGVQDIVKAFNVVLEHYPTAHLVLGNAKGNYSNEIQELLKTIPSNSYTLIAFEEDIFSLYKLFDVFIHVPIQEDVEAFGQTYIESLASGIPSIFTKSGIGLEILEHKKNCWIVNYQSPEEIATGIKTILEDDTLKKNMIQNGIHSAARFNFKDKIRELENLYEAEYVIRKG